MVGVIDGLIVIDPKVAYVFEKNTCMLILDIVVGVFRSKCLNRTKFTQGSEHQIFFLYKRFKDNTQCS